MKHNEFIVSSGSKYEGRICPITKQELTAGTRVIVCPQDDMALSDLVFAEQAECPFCHNVVILVRKPPPHQPPHSAPYRSGRSPLAMTALVAVGASALTIVLILVILLATKVISFNSQGPAEGTFAGIAVTAEGPPAVFTRVPASSPVPTDPPLTNTLQPTAQLALPTPTATPASPPAPVEPTLVPIDPAQAVSGYWNLVTAGDYQRAWASLTPYFRQTSHEDSFDTYVRNLQEWQLCWAEILVEEVNQEGTLASVTAYSRFTQGSGCATSTSERFVYVLVADPTGYGWLIDSVRAAP